MELSLKLKALSRMAHSKTAEASVAIQKAMDKAASSLASDNGYEALEESLSVLKTIGFRNSKQTIEIIRAFLDNVEQRELEIVEDVYGYQTTAALTSSAIDVLREIRYLETTLTIQILLRFAHHGAETVRKKAIDIIEQLTRYNIDAFYGSDRKSGIGPAPQRQVVDFVSSLDDDELGKMFAVVVNICSDVLSPSMSASIWNYQSVTLMSASVPGSAAVAKVRATAISLLKRMYSLATAVTEKTHVIGSLNAATRSEQRGGGDATAAALIEQNTVDVLNFYRSLVGSDELLVVQRIESLCYWIHFHAASANVKSAALAVRDEINKRDEYAIFRVLIGFEGVFADWTDSGGAASRRRDESEIRKTRARVYAESIDSLNYSAWRDRILAYASVESRDLATFPVFYEFLGHFATSSPGLAFDLVTSNAPTLERFLIPLLHGLLTGECRARTRATIEGWIEQGTYIYPVLRALESKEHFDLELAAKLLGRAIADGDVASISAATAVAAENVVDQPLVTTRLFVPALAALTTRRSTDWVFDLWFRSGAKTLISSFDNDGVSLMLRNLLSLDAIDFHVEEILYLIAQEHPRDVLDYLCRRLIVLADIGGSSDTYDAIPYRLHKLDEPLSKIAEDVVKATRDLYHRDSYLFEFRGARLVQTIFPEFSPDLEKALIGLVRTGVEENIDFVVKILLSYDGGPFIHLVAQEVVRAVPSESPALASLSAAMQATGVVTGEFGFVTAYRQKIEEVRAWAVNGDERMRAFVERFVAELELRIIAENRRAEESIALRKHEYGEDVDSADPT